MSQIFFSQLFYRLAGGVGGHTDAVLIDIVDGVGTNGGDVSEDGHSRATGSDTPAVSALLSSRDDVVVGVDSELTPSRNESSEHWEGLDLGISHAVAVSVED